MPQYNRGLQIIINDITLEYNPDTWMEIASSIPSRNKIRRFSNRRKRDVAKNIKNLMGIANDCYDRI